MGAFKQFKKFKSENKKEVKMWHTVNKWHVIIFMIADSFIIPLVTGLCY